MRTVGWPGSLLWTLQPGWSGWRHFNCAWLNGRLAASVASILPCLMNFPFHMYTIYSSFSNKVTQIDKAVTRGKIEISSHGAIYNFHKMNIAGASCLFFILVNQAEIPHMNTWPGWSSEPGQPGLYVPWLGRQKLELTLCIANYIIKMSIFQLPYFIYTVVGSLRDSPTRNSRKIIYGSTHINGIIMGS